MGNGSVDTRIPSAYVEIFWPRQNVTVIKCHFPSRTVGVADVLNLSLLLGPVATLLIVVLDRPRDKLNRL